MTGEFSNITGGFPFFPTVILQFDFIFFFIPLCDPITWAWMEASPHSGIKNGLHSCTRKLLKHVEAIQAQDGLCTTYGSLQVSKLPLTSFPGEVTYTCSPSTSETAVRITGSGSFLEIWRIHSSSVNSGWPQKNSFSLSWTVLLNQRKESHNSRMQKTDS